MTTKQMFDELLVANKKYIDSILKGYSEETKDLATFEKKHMERYSGGAAIDHVLFRKFLRTFDPQNLEDSIAGNVIEIYEERIKELEQENDELRKKVAELEELIPAAL
jgi:hypothetical protein